MNRDDIIRMAREAGLCSWGALIVRPDGIVKAEVGSGPDVLHPCLEKFCDAIHAAVREPMLKAHDAVREAAYEAGIADGRERANLAWLGVVDAAVQAEREACIRMVENEAECYSEPVWALEIVSDIRARGAK